MKLNLTLDLAPIRQRAYNQVDVKFSYLTTDVVARLHDVKYALATKHDPALQAEADWRGLSLNELCAAIVQNHEVARAELLAKDLKRMQYKQRVAAATSEQQIQALLSEVDRE